MGQSHEKVQFTQSIKNRLRNIPFRIPNQRDVEFLSQQTLMSQEEVSSILNNFLSKHPDGRMNRKEYCELYIALRKEAPNMVEGLTENIFHALGVTNTDADFITMNEFLVTFALTTRGDLQKRLAYAFEMYTSDRRNYLEVGECRQIINSILELLMDVNDKDRHRISDISSDCCDDIKVTQIVLKENFINDLIKNKHFHRVMQQFENTRTPS